MVFGVPLHQGHSRYFTFLAAIGMWSSAFWKQTLNAEKPPQKAAFPSKMVRDGRLELPTSCSQSKRATNCANPGFLVIQFCSRCGQTCGQADFLTIFTCEGYACIAGVSRDCGDSIFQFEREASCSQSKRATNCANPGYLILSYYSTKSEKSNLDFPQSLLHLSARFSRMFLLRTE